MLWCWRRRRDQGDGRDGRDVRDDDRVDRRGDGARDDGLLLVPLDGLCGRLLRFVRLCLPLIRGGGLGLLVRAPPSLAETADLALRNAKVREMLQAFREEGPEALSRYVDDPSNSAALDVLRGQAGMLPAPPLAPELLALPYSELRAAKVLNVVMPLVVGGLLVKHVIILI